MTRVGSFRERFGGEIVLPDDPGYDSARAVWNGMADRRPALVVRPVGVDDVRFGVWQARRAWVEPTVVMNTRPRSELLAWVGAKAERVAAVRTA